MGFGVSFMANRLLVIRDIEWLFYEQLIKVAPRVSRPFLDEGPFCMYK